MSLGDVLTETLISTMEGGVGKIKGDEPTVFGLSSTYYPGFVRAYNEAYAKGDKAKMASLRNDAKVIYIRDYLKVIPGYPTLSVSSPGLIALLFFGRVHGLGYRQYVIAIQQWLVANGRRLTINGKMDAQTLTHLNSMSVQEHASLLKALARPASLDDLARQRIRAVAVGGVVGVDKGIRNRVRNELAVAEALNKDVSAQMAMIPEKNIVVTYARTSAVRSETSEIDPSSTINLV